jgi:hypothetical protein
MTRFLAILLFIAPAFADDGSLATCESKNMELMEINTQLGAIAESFRSQLEQRKVQVVRITPVAGKPEKRKAGPCGSQRQVWRKLANGHKKYKCK